MTTVGCTGHQQMPDEALSHATSELRATLTEIPDLIGLTSLAAGADQLFAETVLAVGGELHVKVPSRRYEESFETPSQTVAYERLVAAAAVAEVLDFEEPSEQAFYAAGKAVVDDCDLLLAVWDGQPAKGLGGSADVVHYALTQGTPVRVIWPDGVRR